MKKTSWILVGILFLALLVSNIFRFMNSNKNKGITQTELFEKKQECTKYMDYLQKKVDNETEELREAGWFYHKTINEVFYSTSKNSCFALLDETYSYPDSQEVNNLRWIVDILTNDETNYDKEDMFLYYERIKELRGE